MFDGPSRKSFAVLLFCCPLTASRRSPWYYSTLNHSQHAGNNRSHRVRGMASNYRNLQPALASGTEAQSVSTPQTHVVKKRRQPVTVTACQECRKRKIKVGYSLTLSPPDFQVPLVYPRSICAFIYTHAFCSAMASNLYVPAVRRETAPHHASTTLRAGRMPSSKRLCPCRQNLTASKLRGRLQRL